MEELKQRLLTRFKALKGISDDSKDDVFLFAIESAVQAILTYCHLDILEWPSALDNTAVLMALDNYQEATSVANFETAEAEVTDMTEGDFKISTVAKSQTYARLAGQKSLSRTYKTALNRFRKLA